MPLAPGARLGAYEILAPIGAGGMGEVYRARDTKLQREVAVKVLPGRLAESEDALARFEREARIVAALSHPNILAIHDLGREGAVAYAVMELLEGQSLREELRGGPLPPRKAATYAAQAAEGLAAAHDKAVVHRDLKPENLFVTRDGRLKVLDFGLARQETPAAPTEHSQSPTLVRQTDPGTVVGTVGYMSPEQVRGESVDHRSDLFSLGCVLHEMLSGRRAFGRDTAAETMTAILREDPGPLADGGAIPPALERIVAHCLEKKPAERFQSARDLAFDLASLSGSSAHARTAPRSGRARLLPWLASALGAAALVGLGYQAGRGAGPERGDLPLAHAHFTQLTDLSGVESSPSLSPDGKTLAFVSRVGGNADVYVQRVGGHNPIDLTKDCERDDSAPAFSPDGERIAFRSECEGGGIFVMGATGESRRRVADFGYDPAWSPDGSRLAVVTEPVRNPLQRVTDSELWLIDVATGERRRLPAPDAMQPSWSPGGERIAFWGLRGGVGGTGRRDLWTVATRGGEPLELTNDEAVDWNPLWSPDGRQLYFASGRGGTMNVWRMPVDAASGRSLGPAEPVAAPARSIGAFRLSRDARRLAFAASEERSSLYRIAFDAAQARVVGEPQLILGGSRVFSSLGLSADGNWVAWSDAGLRENVFVIRVDGSGYRQLTDDAFRNRGPAWSTDGSVIGFYSNRSGRYEVWTVHPDGGSLEQLTQVGTGSLWFPEWSHDGTRVAIAGIPATRILDLTRPRGERESNLLPATPEGVFQASSWSPDGTRLAGTLQKSDNAMGGVLVYDFESRRYQRLTATGGTPSLLADGRRLLYVDGGSIVFLDPATRVSRPVLAIGQPSAFGTQRRFRLSRDNRTIVFFRTEIEADIWLMSFD